MNDETDRKLARVANGLPTHAQPVDAAIGQAAIQVAGRDGSALADTLARAYAPEAIRTLVNVMRDASAKPSERTRAAESLLDRGYGRPTSTTVVLPAKRAAADRLAQLPDSALLAVVQAARARGEGRGPNEGPADGGTLAGPMDAPADRSLPPADFIEHDAKPRPAKSKKRRRGTQTGTPTPESHTADPENPWD